MLEKGNFINNRYEIIGRVGAGGMSDVYKAKDHKLNRNVAIKVLKKEPFSGSHQGMRFFMRAEDDTLHVWVYPEPWCFEKTSDDMKTAKDFPFTQEGLDDSMEWISQEFENRKDYWMQMEKDKMKMILQGRGDS